jgi:hypothetical protein
MNKILSEALAVDIEIVADERDAFKVQLNGAQGAATELQGVVDRHQVIVEEQTARLNALSKELKQRKQPTSASASLRTEIWIDDDDSRVKMTALQTELEMWRSKWMELLSENDKLTNQVKAAHSHKARLALKIEGKDNSTYNSANGSSSSDKSTTSDNDADCDSVGVATTYSHPSLRCGSAGSSKRKRRSPAVSLVATPKAANSKTAIKTAAAAAPVSSSLLSLLSSSSSSFPSMETSTDGGTIGDKGQQLPSFQF